MKSLKKISKWQLIELGVLTLLTVVSLFVGRAYLLCKAEISESLTINRYQEQTAALRLLEDNNRIGVNEGFDRLSYADTVMNSDVIQAGLSQLRVDAANRSDLSSLNKIDEKQRTLKSLGTKGRSDAEIFQQNETLLDAIRYSMLSTIKQVFGNNQLQFKAEIYFGLLMFLNGLILSMLIANLIFKYKGRANSKSAVLMNVIS